MEQTQKSAGIIGAGIAGIALSIRLACKGYLVRVFEANPYPGGKLSEIQLDGYRFDAGPSLFTLPQEVDKLFELAGEVPGDWFRYRKLSVACKYLWEDKTIIEAFADPQRFADELEQKTGVDSKNVLAAFSNSKLLYELLSELFMYRSLHSWRTFCNTDAWKAYRNLHRMDFFRSMHQANSRMLKENKAVQLFNRYATYNGSNPYQAPATLNIIPYLEMGLGAYFPEGGMHSITKSLVALAQRLGVQFYLNTPVDKIQLKEGKATGLTAKGKAYAFDAVISNARYKQLIPEEEAKEEEVLATTK